MADYTGGESSSSSAMRRAATDLVLSVAMAGEESHDEEAIPRVRFSEDLDRATASAAAGQRPGTQNLTIDTNPPPKKSTLGKKPVSHVSATSPRTRDRGYSLRRSLFTRTTHNQSENSPIELLEAGPSREQDNNERMPEDGKWKQSRSAINVSPVSENATTGISMIEGRELSSEYSSKKGTDKKTFGTLSLPNYDVFARERMQKNAHLKWIQMCKEMALGVIRPKQVPPSKDGRHLNLDASRGIPFIDERTGKEFIGNSIRSSRYTIWNFVPRQLYFQFSKLANFYFLLISILQMIPGLSTTGNYSTIAPLLVFVTISITKEGWDDYRRYKLDKIENNRTTQVLRTYQRFQGGQIQFDRSTLNGDREITSESLHPAQEANASLQERPELSDPTQERNHWEPLRWRDVKAGDIIKLERNDPVPADILLLHVDGRNGIAYIETMALDGETNLKSKQAPVDLAKLCSSVDEIAECRAHVVVEDPNLDLYNFDGRITVDGKTLPLTTNEIVFRGSTLRNTSSATGMVINTGEECKIRMNANKNPRIKAPAIQTITNKIVVMLVIFVIILALFCTIAYQIWAENTEEKAWYIQNAHVPFSQIIIGFIILYNTLIPLSLYVSLEIIKIGQFILMADVEMYDPVSNTPMICNTTTILENLGQVDYIFSDKTGTLTDNVMKFRKLSVAGYAFLHDFDVEKKAEKLEQTQETIPNEPKRKGKGKGKGVARWPSKRKANFRPVLQRSEISNSSNRGSGSIRRSGSVWKSSARPNKVQPELRTEEMLKFMQYKPHSVFTKKAKFFLLSLALCHTCLPEVKESGDIEFQAASPDELALVQAAQDLGYLVIDRPAQSITLRLPGPDSEVTTEIYDILDVIEFSSKRKRMSIIVRFPNGKICIFCKGADSAILPRLKLAPLALQKQSEVTRRSSKRKSMEAEQALRRMSEHSPRTSFSRPSMSTSRPNIGRKSTTISRHSIASQRLQPIRDELDSWLRQRESDVEATPDDISIYHSPRASMAPGRFSFASDERRGSSQDEEYYDTIVDEALVLDDAAVFERCFQHIDDFASEGLRTLLFGYKFLDEEEYTGWKKIYIEATTSLIDRQKLIENAGEMIEQNFDLVGATAIEDKLQKGVPETIDKLRRANIKIWMLTGDKRETAINIAHSARISKSYSEVIILDHTTGEVEQRMAAALLDISKGSIAHSVVVVDGQTLSEIDANETLSLLFFDLAVLANSVICCRASPSQKASLVKKIRTKVNHSTTLAIGDGANDIAMILEAHVGIGVSGKEGLQAARISDYSIAQFRFLQRLLLVHGRWNYIRTSKYILATFWKELMFYLLQALYQHWTGYTGTSLFESTSLTVFNTLFTSLPVIFLGIFEQDLNASTLLAIPELYVQGQKNQAFNIKKYIAWMFMAVSESMMIYFTMLGLFGIALFGGGVFTKPNDQSLLAMGTLCFTSAIVFINTKVLFLEMHNKTFLSALGWLLPVGGWFLWTLVLSALFKPTEPYPLYPIYRSFIDGFGGDFLWWLVIFLALTSLTLFEIGVSSIRKSFWPTDTDVFQELQKDKLIRERFEETIRREAEGSVPEIEMGREVKSSMEARREDEIQELLDRPRVMNVVGAEVVHSPIEMNESVSAGVSRSASGHLKKRKFSIDTSIEGPADSGQIGIGARSSVLPKTRHSVDIAELLGRRTGPSS